MSVDYRAVLGYGIKLTEDEIADPDEIGAYEVLEALARNYPLVAFETGGGGWSNSDTEWVLLIKGTVQELGEVDGVIELRRPFITADAITQLNRAYREATATRPGHPLIPEPQWLIAGGFY